MQFVRDDCSWARKCKYAHCLGRLGYGKRNGKRSQKETNQSPDRDGFDYGC